MEEEDESSEELEIKKNNVILTKEKKTFYSYIFLFLNSHAKIIIF